MVGNVNRSKETNGSPSKAHANSVPNQHSIYPIGQNALAFLTKSVIPEGLFIVIAESLASANIKGRW